MTHQTANMAMMKRRCERIGERVGRVDDSRDICQDNLTVSFPFLNCKMLYVNMTRSWGRGASIIQQNSGSIIFVESTWLVLLVAKLGKDRLGYLAILAA